MKDGATVFLSSHILSEVEKTCDRVAIIRDGKIVKLDTVEGLRDLAHHQVELRFAGTVPIDAFSVAARRERPRGRRPRPAHARLRCNHADVVQAAAHYELLDFVSREPSLEETFLAQYGHEAAEVK